MNKNDELQNAPLHNQNTERKSPLDYPASGNTSMNMTLDNHFDIGSVHTQRNDDDKMSAKLERALDGLSGAFTKPSPEQHQEQDSMQIFPRKPDQSKYEERP